MIIYRFQLFLIFMVVLIGSKVQAQNKISQLDFKHQYNLNSLRGDMICTQTDSAAFFLLQFSAPNAEIKDFSLSYSLLNSTSDEVTRYYKLQNLSHYFQYEDSDGSQYGIQVNLDNHQYIVFWLTDSLSRTSYPFFSEINEIQTGNGMALSRGIFNTALIEHYEKVGTSIRINEQINVNDSVVVDYYDYHFLPAKPPMSRAPNKLQVPFTVDKTFSISSKDTFSLTQKGLYHFRFPKTNFGYSLLSSEEFYPKFSTIEKLVESLRYIARNSEYVKMNTSFEKKELFDEFWLNNTKSPERARSAIKEYYERVREANILFTNYKEGWKTDMGMIYIIFGPPSNVFYDDKGVMWIYGKTFELPRISFSFTREVSVFPTPDYILERKAEYENLWFRTVSLWRSGKKEY